MGDLLAELTSREVPRWDLDVVRAEWESALHPRGPHGKFARKPGKGLTSDEPLRPAGTPKASAPHPLAGELKDGKFEFAREPRVGDWLKDSWGDEGQVTGQAPGFVAAEWGGRRAIINTGNGQLLHGGMWWASGPRSLEQERDWHRVMAGKPPLLPHVPPRTGIALSPERKRLTDALSRGVSEADDLSMGTQGVVTLLDLADGSRAVRKKFANAVEDHTPREMADSEELAGLVAEAIGGTGAPPVVRTGDAEVTMGFAPGQLAEQYWYDRGVEAYHPYDDRPEFFEGDRSIRIGLPDKVIRNPDRHCENYMIDDSSGEPLPVPIDNNGGFRIGYPGSWLSPFEQGLDEVTASGTGGFSENQLNDIQANLAGLEDEFDQA